MSGQSIRAWLGLDRAERDELAPLRDTLEALEHLEPDRARFLAAFAYLLGRVAHADQHVSPEETRAIEALVQEQGRLSQDQAMVCSWPRRATFCLAARPIFSSRGRSPIWRRTNRS